MRINFLFKAFTFFIAAQFLNVQIQAAYGTEALTQSSPELVQVLKEMENKVRTRVEHLSEKAQLRYAYRLYKTDVKLRNRTFKKTDQEIQDRIEALDQNKINQEAKSIEDQQLEQTLNSEPAFEDLASAQKIKVSFRKNQIKREQLLKNTDPLLIDLGSELNEDGTFSKASFETFQNKVFEINKAQDARSPAAMNVIVKVILALLIVAAGLAILYFVLAVFAIAAAFGSAITPMGLTVLILLTLGSITGMFFGLRAVIHAKRSSGFKTLVFA